MNISSSINSLDLEDNSNYDQLMEQIIDAVITIRNIFKG